ncbi:uncharacterized protein TNCV_1930871 [Trichonephila clavipes]|nr:uncharacterized protein TNCV_1930871 [Trichonephila clavipes]
MWAMVAPRLIQITAPAATPDQLWKRVEAAWSAVPRVHILNQCRTMWQRGNLLVKLLDRDWRIMRLSPVRLKIRRLGKRCTLNLSRAQTFSRWCGVVVGRGGSQLRCCPHHLTMVQNDEVHRRKLLCSLTVRR